ncbi:hypothetical protein [Paraburkholderia sp. JHI869]|uniref:hypothetical protein n=1 Tax=Paraburkholderia sp. JHI869 TaxID=3112959 RepID=UPI003175679E
MNKPRNTTVLNVDLSNSLLSYMADCRFDESHLTPMHLALVLEYAYQPHPRFWRDFDIAILVDAISRHMPHWQSTASMTDGGANEVLRELDATLEINAFDEANAEMLLAAPIGERPETPASALAWITAELVRRQLTTQLRFARRDGERCGEMALDVAYCLEQAKLGNIVERTGTIVAKAYRDAVMKRRAE